MDKIDFFTGPNGNYALTHLIVLENIGDGAKSFGHFETEGDVIRQIAHITNDKNYRIHKLMIINENGESKELDVDFSNGKLRLRLRSLRSEKEEVYDHHN